MTLRKICVITGSRAEYGLLYWLLKEIQQDECLELQLVVTGMHLSSVFGDTYKVIEKDGFEVTGKVDMQLSDDSPSGIVRSMGIGMQGFADVFDDLKPDLVVINGDRYEVLVAAQAAMIFKIPIAHISGGEATECVIDEAIRHSLTKMSHLHFVASEKYRNRVIQLGEEPGRVFQVGAIGLDNISRIELLDRDAFEKSLDFKLAGQNFLVTYHPVTLSHESPAVPFGELLKALDVFPDSHVIFTLPNADTQGKSIIKMIDDYVGQNPNRTYVTASLGQLRYLSAVRHVDAVIGNSSSGLVEVPALKTPTVNLGERQRGRLRANTVIDCDESKDSIVSAIQKAVSEDFKKELAQVKSPYGTSGRPAEAIKDIIRSFPLDRIVMKKFYDIKVET